MKNPANSNSNRIENSAIAISTSLDEPRLLRSLVEKLADRRYDIGYSLEKVQTGWQAIETSSIEAHASGEITLSTETDLFNIPFVACFLFTCTKGKWLNYNFTWVHSLSWIFFSAAHLINRNFARIFCLQVGYISACSFLPTILCLHQKLIDTSII